MPSLILSRRDVDFLLYEWLDVTALTARARFADHSRETFDSALDAFETIATERFAPHRKKNDQQEPQFDGERVTLNPEVGEAVRAYGEAGLVAATQDYELGGMQLPDVVASAGMAFMYAANVGTAGYPLLTVGNANLLIAHGGPALIDKYVRPMLAGRFFGTMCLSEPQAGSSLADITTRAELQADGRYRLFGNKMWISAADHEMSENIIHLVLAKIPGPDGRLPPGVQGISLFVVPRRLLDADGEPGERNDVSVAGLNHKMGYRGTVNCALNFGEGRFQPEGAPGALGEIVGEPGKGLAYMFHMMNEARIGVGLSAASLGNTGYLHALDYARQRRQGRPQSSRDPSQPQVPIIEHPDVRRMLLAQKAWAEGGLALSLFCARLVDDEVTGVDEAARAQASLLLDLLTPVAKSWPSQWCTAANDLAIQVHGGYGYTREYNVEQFYRDNRLNAIHEGTHGIQALDLLGRKVRAQGGAALTLVGARVSATVARARELPALAAQAGKLAAAWTRVVEVTARLQAVSDPALRLANATPYLEAFGHVFVGWLWLDMACVAAEALHGAAGEDADYYRGKVQASAYYMTWELPRIEAWLAVLDPVDATCLEMQPSWF